MNKFLKFSVAYLAVLSFAACSNPDLSQDFDQRESLDAGFPTEKRAFQGEADASHQWEANEKLTKLLASFGSERAMENHERPKYPEYYGGGYITEQGGLVIHVYGDLEKGKRAVVSVIGGENIEFKTAEHSYAYLTSLMDEFNDFAIKGEDSQIMEMLTGFSLMDMTNDVEVQVIGLDERKLEILKRSIFNKPGVRFEHSEGKVRLETIHPGCDFDVANGYGSVGFRAKRNSDGAIGFVTAGHVISVWGIAFQGPVPIGVCESSQQSGTIDAAFVVLTNPNEDYLSNTLCSTSNLLSVATTLPGVGTIVNKIGGATGHTTGKIISTNATTATGTSNGSITNLTKADYISAGGDSGGIIYTYIRSNGRRFTAGIHTAANGSMRYYTKADNILNVFGLLRD